MKLIREALAVLVLSHVEAADMRLRGGQQLEGAQQLGSPQDGVSAPALSDAVEVRAPGVVPASAPAFVLEVDAVIDFLGDGAMSMPDKGNGTVSSRTERKST